jgi:diguanylate cyclase (GGDEF)-like protein
VSPLSVSFIERNYNRLLVLLFVAITLTVYFIGQSYKAQQIYEYEHKQYHKIADSVHNEISTLIDEKKNATLTIALSITNNDELLRHLKAKSRDNRILKEFSMRLRQETDFKNVWIQLINSKGISVARSWTDKRNDNIGKVREDVRSMVSNPRVHSTISVGRFDMTFKSMVPVYDNHEFLGFLEVITHFNSIARKLEDKAFTPVILVDKRFREQLIHPFTGIFAGDRYIANKNVDLGLLDYIHFKGLDYFLSPHQKFIIDEERQTLVINYTLFDTENRPMANFLVFKPLAEIDDTKVSDIAANINLYMLLVVIITGFMLFQFSNKKVIDNYMSEYQWLLIAGLLALFIVLSAIYYVLLAWNHDQKRTDFLERYNASISRDYEIIYDKFSLLGNALFQTNINNDKVLHIMEQADSASEAERQQLRQQLLKELEPTYTFFKEHGIRQLHFHLRNNHSFLRFHRPEKHGDDLTDIRSTIAWVNASQRPIHGFEEGRIFNGYRNVFPLLVRSGAAYKKHVGSVETSFSPYVVAKAFAEAHNSRCGFVIKSDIVESKVFRKEQGNYTLSKIPGYYKDVAIKQQLESSFRHVNLTELSDAALLGIDARASEGSVFTLPDSTKNSLFSFIPLKNPVTKKVVAMLIIQSEDPVLNNIRQQFNILLTTGIISLLMIILFIYRELQARLHTRHLLEKSQEILDAQSSIVIVTNGTEIIDCNRKFLHFLGFQTLDQFKEQYNCICDLFVENDRYFHLGKVEKTENWINIIDMLPHKDQVVMLINKNGNPHIFNVNVNQFKTDFIVTFTDISDTMSQHLILEKRATLDKLTGAYNRDFFEHNIDQIIENTFAQQMEVGLVMFDIDHFKSVNDTYGHDVGDDVLIAFAQTVNQATRHDDILIRWGGEEFILVIAIDSIEKLAKVTESIRRKIERVDILENRKVTASFGITLYRKDEAIDIAIKRADTALYNAKANGRNCVISA